MPCHRCSGFSVGITMVIYQVHYGQSSIFSDYHSNLRKISQKSSAFFAYLYIRFYEKLPVYYENQRHNHIKHLAFPILGDSTTTERDDQEGTSGFHKAVYGILTEIYQCDLPQG